MKNNLLAPPKGLIPLGLLRNLKFVSCECLVSLSRCSLLVTFFFLVTSISFAQKEVTWDDLAKVTYTDKFFAEYDDYFMYPEFSGSVKALEGKQITIKGYFLDIDAQENLFVLSKGPMSSCFFCGQGGPETTLELQFTNPSNFKTDNIISITGILQLNKDDVEHFNYILTDCKGELIK